MLPPSEATSRADGSSRLPHPRHLIGVDRGAPQYIKSDPESTALDANELKGWTVAHFRSLKAKSPSGV
jgi:hypothetical protein